MGGISGIGSNIVSDFGFQGAGYGDTSPTLSNNFPVFGSNGKLQGNLTSSFGQAPTIESSPLPAIGGSTSGLPAAASASGITGGATPPASTTGNVASASTVNNWFVRAVVVILGFVFVAVGLSQFGVVQRMGPGQ